MKILILGAGGMLGHKLMQLLQIKYEVYGTVRKPAGNYRRYGLFNHESLIGGVDVADFASVEKVIAKVQPHFVINSIGIIKQLNDANDPVKAIGINSLFPHRLASVCRATDIHFVHISTDCVFSGKRGMYKESDVSDATDMYGRTKFLGEVSGPNCLTLRTSIIGHALDSSNGLLDWFLSQGQNEIHGYRKAIYSGLTTIELAHVIQCIIESPKEINGLYQVSSEPINKFDLLSLVRDAFHVCVKLVPVDIPVIDRSLNSDRFRKTMNYRPPSWHSMIKELAEDKTPYLSWRKVGQSNCITKPT